MAEKKNNTPAAKKNAPDKKKVLVVVLVIAVIVIAAFFMDARVKNPPINDTMAASNRVFGEGVLANNPEITYDTEVTVWEDPETVSIEGKQYWVVHVEIYPETPQSKEFVYYVAQKNGKIHQMDEATQKLVPYGV